MYSLEIWVNLCIYDGTKVFKSQILVFFIVFYHLAFFPSICCSPFFFFFWARFQIKDCTGNISFPRCLFLGMCFALHYSWTGLLLSVLSCLFTGSWFQTSEPFYHSGSDMFPCYLLLSTMSPLIEIYQY